MAAMPQSRGHLTPGERVEGGQLVEPRRGRHFRLGHDYSSVSMTGEVIDAISDTSSGE
jgi:hypothetical protein